MQPRRKIKIRKLSKDFAIDINADTVRRCVLPAKSLLEMLIVWPGTDNTYITIIDWIIFANIMVMEIFHATYAVVNRKDIVTVLLVSATVTTTMEALVRVYIIVHRKDILNDILYKIWMKFWPVSSMSPKLSKKLVTKCYVSVVLTLGCFGPAIFCNTLISLTPYLVENDLVLKSVFPFQWNKTYIYEGIYVWQYFTEWYLLLLVNVFDNFVVAIMAICVVQFIILQNIFESILTQDSNYHRMLLFGKRISNRDVVRHCLDQQRMLIEICENIEYILSVPMLVQFFNSTAALCASCIVLKVEPSQFAKMLTYAIAHMFQLFNYCYIGNELSIQTGNMATAVYNCNWEASDDTHLKKSVILMIQRSQKVQIFTAADITELNLESYIKVLRLSFSFYTLFNNFIDRKNNSM